MKTAAIVIAALLTSGAAAAQPSDADRCETAANQRKDAWAAGTHSDFADSIESERQQLTLAWCRARASSREERVHHFEDFGRVLFTGDGVHPVIGTIAPGNGISSRA